VASSNDEYSAIADEQLDEMEAGPDAVLYNATLDAIELILAHPAEAQQHSSAITTRDGVRLVLPIVGYPNSVYWSSGPPPRIEAVFQSRHDERHALPSSGVR
jgi:hypothetical protein